MASKLFIITILVTLISIFLYYNTNEVYNTSNNDPYLLNDIKIITYNENIEKHLLRYKTVLGNDYEGYRGHIYRVLTYAIHFLNGNEDKLSVIGSALVFHDIGLWTDGTLAYLEPSVSRADEYFNIKTFNKQDRQLLKDIIYWHHKITPFKGPNEHIVNAVIKGDIIDASSGLITKGMPKSHIKRVNDAIPEAGFHKTLMDFGPRLHGWNIIKIVVDLSSILKW